MQTILEPWAPNLVTFWDEFIKSIIETIQMFSLSGIISFVLGLLLGVIFVITKPNGITPNRLINTTIDVFVNVFRSIPFIILIAFMIPVTRMIAGTSIGVKGAIFPLVLGCVPFFTRQIDLALSSIDPGLIEAAKAMGVSNLGIIFRIYLPESIPAIARSTTITAISLLGLTAMGGAVGAGGIGSFVLRYGYQRYYNDIMIVCILLILFFVLIIQLIGDIVIEKTTH
ncbi:methionine ABC transporter permease [Fundicoccus culcitae]|uniref:ABC transporter permease n=1 Tax=Fundicoccus culcitae TaxID=2969821 RepID=A0ABY5P7C1_9LACT|nr:methionine ABC transporter permease [Fundicoccus culcitae]UUX34495.1 ABC transporter permease [Fundicoccus culcitae]